VTDTNVLKLVQPGTFSDLLADVLRSGAHALLAQAVEAEVASFLAANAHLQTEDARQRLVRHGHLPERRIATGIGTVTVRQPRVRDRGQPGETPIRFSPAILPPYARRTKSLEVLIPILHLKGISTGDFEEALMALVGTDADGLSASTIARLKEIWAEEHARWQQRDLSAKRYVYLWTDGVYFQARLEDDAQCILVIIGATARTRVQSRPSSSAESCDEVTRITPSLICGQRNEFFSNRLATSTRPVPSHSNSFTRSARLARNT
jgi:transposase-like protein